MNIFIDTNSLETRNLQNDVQLSQVFGYCEKYGCKVYISRVVLLELIHHKLRVYEYIKQFAKSWNAKYRSLTDGDLQQTFVDVNVEQTVNDLLCVRSEVEIVDNSAEDIEWAVRCLYTGRKPAKTPPQAHGLGKEEHKVLEGYAWQSAYDEPGMKDVFIWRSFLHLLEKAPQGLFIFLTKNKNDFGSRESNKSELKFHQELLDDLGENAARVTYVAELHDLIKFHISPLEEFSIVSAYSTFKDALEVILQACSEAGIEFNLEEVNVREVLDVLEKRPTGFGKFSCLSEVLLGSEEEEDGHNTLTLRVDIQVKPSGYELIGAVVE